MNSRKKNRYSLLLASFLAVLALPLPLARAAFTITVTGLEGTAWRAYFDQATAFWESAVTGYADADIATQLPGGITITATMADLVGSEGTITLGQAGPSGLLYGKSTATTGYLFTTSGKMTFNSSYAPYSEAAVATFSQSFYDVVLHEMGHVLGLGTLWSIAAEDLWKPDPVPDGFQGVTFNPVLDPGDPLKYTGEHALANYRTEFNQPSATYVPVEDEGGDGTAGGHWDEVYLGANNTGFISNLTGQDMRYELMTGWADSPMFLSSVTLGALEDLGYIVNYDVLTMVPEPAVHATLAGVVLLAYAALRRRRV